MYFVLKIRRPIEVLSVRILLSTLHNLIIGQSFPILSHQSPCHQMGGVLGGDYRMRKLSQPNFQKWVDFSLKRTVLLCFLSQCASIFSCNDLCSQNSIRQISQGSHSLMRRLSS